MYCQILNLHLSGHRCQDGQRLRRKRFRTGYRWNRWNRCGGLAKQHGVPIRWRKLLIWISLSFSELVSDDYAFPTGYYDSHPVISWFWDVMQTFENEKRLRLLQVRYAPCLVSLQQQMTKALHDAIRTAFFFDYVHHHWFMRFGFSLSQGLRVYHLRVSRHCEEVMAHESSQSRNGATQRVFQGKPQSITVLLCGSQWLSGCQPCVYCVFQSSHMLQQTGLAFLHVEGRPQG